jgi:hypothetical protein
MDFLKKALIGLASVGILYYGVQELKQVSANYKEADRKFKIVENSYIEELKKNSSFNQTPITIEIPKINRNDRQKREWCDRFVSVSINPSDILYSKGRRLFLSKDKDKNSVEIVSDNVPLYKNYLFAINLEGKENSDIYFIDRTRKLKKLEYQNGKYVDAGISIELQKYFIGIPRNLELGDVNADKKVDIIYEGNTIIGNRRGNSINVLLANKDYGFTDIDAVYYLGNERLRNLSAKDFDGDGDCDISFMVQGNDKEFFGLENKTKQSINPLNFENNFRKRVRTNNSSNLLIYHMIINQ